jgi:hypothetical protein
MTRLMSTLHDEQYTFWSSLSQLFLVWEMSHTIGVDKIKTQMLYAITFSRTPCRLWDNAEEYDKAEQATDNSIILSSAFLSG